MVTICIVSNVLYIHALQNLYCILAVLVRVNSTTIHTDMIDSSCPAAAEDGMDKDCIEEYSKALQLQFVADIPEIVQLLSQQYIDLDATASITALFNKYQQSSRLLDRSLQQLIHLSITHIYNAIHNNTVLSTKQSQQQLHNICKILYTLCKIRGHKTIMIFLPHSVNDLELLIDLLYDVHMAQTHYVNNPNSMNDAENDTNWETSYMLLLWLCIVILVPFNLSIVDSTINHNSTQLDHHYNTDGENIFTQLQRQSSIPSTGIIHRLIWLSLVHMQQPGVQHNCGALLLARLMSRTDIPTDILVQYIDYCASTLDQSYTATHKQSFLAMSILTSLFELLKLIQRQIMLQYIDKLMCVLTKHNWLQHKNTLIRKMIVKITQRIGLIYLKPRLANWRYDRGKRELFDKIINNNSNNNSTVVQHNNKDSNDVDDAGDMDVPSEVEELIGILLDGLCDSDTIVRWSAAKGIGRITMCLSNEYCNDIIQSIIDLLKPYNSDCIWHGCMLSIGELARRGLLLPDKLRIIVPLTLNGLVYDIRNGQYSIGSNVRDSACYVIWAFARAYQPIIMSPYVASIANHLLPVAVYDKEINVRRAACAAYQENVGRQGGDNWPHGIDINTAADYFTVTNRNESYLNIAVYIAQYESYNIHLVNHLVKHKLKHWNKEIRCLAATALAKLCTVTNTHEYITNTILDELHGSAHSNDVCERHGALMAISDILVVLYENNIQLHPTIQQSIIQLIPELDRLLLLGNAGGAILRESVCYMIQSLAKCNTVLSDDMVIYYETHINNNITHPNDSVCNIAIESLHQFAQTYYIDRPNARADHHIQNYVQCMLHTPSMQQTRGVVLAISSLPIQLIQSTASDKPSNTLQQIIYSLILNTKVNHQSDPETRRNSIRSLIDIVLNINGLMLQPLDPSVIDHTVLYKPNQNDRLSTQYIYHRSLIVDSHRIIDHTINVLLLCCDDYSIDNRGDIGSIVRQQAIQSMTQLMKHIISKPYNNSILGNAVVIRCISSMIKQMCEKLDKLRCVAAECLIELIHDHSFNKLIPHVDAVLPQAVHRNNNNTVCDCGSPQFILNQIVPLLQYDEYRHSVLSGIVISMGGLTELTALSAQYSLMSYLSTITVDQLYTITQCIIDILIMYKGHTRVIVPTLRSIDYMLTNNIFELLYNSQYQFASQLYNCMLNEITKSTQVNKIQSSINIFIQLLSLCQSSDELLYTQLIKTIGLLLTHRYPIIRKHTAKLLHDYNATVELLLDVDDDCIFHSVQLQSINTILNSIQWDMENIILIRDRRDEISLLYGVQPTVSNIKQTHTEEKQNTSNNNDYASFIDGIR